MIIRTPNVQHKNKGNPKIAEIKEPPLTKFNIVISKKTLANYPCAKLKAQSLR